MNLQFLDADCLCHYAASCHDEDADPKEAEEEA